jgi:hypothetical protein
VAQTPHNKAKYESLVIAVATGQSIINWCKDTKTPRSTVSVWQLDPKFERDVAALRRKMVNEAIGKFVASVGQVAEGMIKLAEQAASEPTKLAAQKAVMENLVQMSDFAELRKRLDDLEEWRRESEQRNTGQNSQA